MLHLGPLLPLSNFSSCWMIFIGFQVPDSRHFQSLHHLRLSFHFAYSFPLIFFIFHQFCDSDRTNLSCKSQISRVWLLIWRSWHVALGDANPPPTLCGSSNFLKKITNTELMFEVITPSSQATGFVSILFPHFRAC